MTYSQFIAMHGPKIESASITANMVTIEVKDHVLVRDALILFADLINTLKPLKATMVDPRRIRLEVAA